MPILSNPFNQLVKAKLMLSSDYFVYLGNSWLYTYNLIILQTSIFYHDLKQI